MAGFQIGTNTSTSMPVYPDYVQKPMQDFYGALSGTGMLGRAGGYQGSVAPWNKNLSGAFDAAGGMLSGNTNWAPSIAGAGQLDPNSIGRFVDPYAKSVGKDAIDAIGESYDNADAQAAAQAASGAAFPGSGSGLALQRAQMARSEAKDKASTLTGILSGAWNQGAQLADANASRGLQSAIGADNGQTNFQQRGQGALSSLIQTGQLRQGQDQQTADLPYTDLNRFLQLLSGAPSGQQDQTPVTFDPIAALGSLFSLKF